MAENTLDRLSAQYDEDVRRVVADIIGGGGTRQNVVDHLAARYDFTVTTRTVTNWMTNDDALVEMLAAQQVARRAIDPNAAADLPPARNRAQDDANLFRLMDLCPAFGAFLYSDADRAAATAATVEVGNEFAAAAPAAAPDADDPRMAEIAAVLQADDIEAASLAALGVETLDEYLATIEVPLAGAGRFAD